jgi:ATP-dependent RNA helicase RhlE
LYLREELVVQVVDNINGMLNIWLHAHLWWRKQHTSAGLPLVLTLSLQHQLYDACFADFKTKTVKVVIDEVDVLDLGFGFQLTNIFDHLPPKT